ncbi:MAG: flagellar biosynthetic protein FliR [Gammaproteobacteria bacterium]|nr:MAG: flagellar biosynthetic protein FliR [Gammaproteobacteria bacterium]HDY82687.1 flagellar biosynthetic protein FliR [Halieaceae bacterium]
MFSAGDLLAWSEQYYWPFLRISALFLASPIFGASSFPVRARVLLAVMITALVVPSLPMLPKIDLLGAAGLLVAGQQVIIGLAMGFIVQMVFAAVVVAGQSLAMAMGLGFAMSVDPQNGVQVPVLSQLYMILATLLFLGVNGHLLLIQFLVNSFTLLPVGLSGLRHDFGLDVVLWASQMFLGALVLALPALTALLLINIAFGVVTRAAPQLNIFAVGFPVTILAGFVFIFLTMPSVLSQLMYLFDTGLSQALLLIR